MDTKTVNIVLERDKELIKKGGTSLIGTKSVTIALERYEELIKAEERLAVIKTITNQPHPYDHDKIRLIQAILEVKQCEITSETI